MWQKKIAIAIPVVISFEGVASSKATLIGLVETKNINSRKTKETINKLRLSVIEQRTKKGKLRAILRDEI